LSLITHDRKIENLDRQPAFARTFGFFEFSSFMVEKIDG